MNPTALDQLGASPEQTITGNNLDDIYSQMSNMPSMKSQRFTPSDEEAITVLGDLERLSPEARMMYYLDRCNALGLDPNGHPFDYIRTPLDRSKTAYRTVLYANKNCASQLTKKFHVSTEILSENEVQGTYHVKARASMPIIVDGVILGSRFADDIGVSEIAGKGGDSLGNSKKRAVTQAKRRAILGLCGLSLNDETEVQQIRGAITISPNEVERGLKAVQQRLLPVSSESSKSSKSSVSTTEESK